MFWLPYLRPILIEAWVPRCKRSIRELPGDLVEISLVLLSLASVFLSFLIELRFMLLSNSFERMVSKVRFWRVLN